jgi:hypothetical protein
VQKNSIASRVRHSPVAFRTTLTARLKDIENGVRGLLRGFGGVSRGYAAGGMWAFNVRKPSLVTASARLACSIKSDRRRPIHPNKI